MKRPEREKVYFSKLGKELFLDFISIADDEWMGEAYGEAKIRSAFGADGLDIDVVLGVFWRILDADGKRIILSCKIEQYEDGNMKLLQFDDPVKKLKSIVCGQDEILSIMMAIGQSRIKSNPNMVENAKKKVMEEGELHSGNASI